jgi:PAS domain S-box-containing protein
VETAQELVWKCDTQGRFTYLNPAWEKTHGYKIEEMLGRCFGEFQRPEVFERDREEFARELAGESVTEYETTHIARDGRELTLLFNVVPEVNPRGEVIGTQGTATDITERKLAETALKKSEAFVKNILESVDEGIIVLDRDYRVISANNAYLRMAGKSEAEVINNKCHELAHGRPEICINIDEDCPVRKTFNTGKSYISNHVHQIKVNPYIQK